MFSVRDTPFAGLVKVATSRPVMTSRVRLPFWSKNAMAYSFWTG